MSDPKTVTAKRILELLEEQDHRCALSGRQLTPETASIDHIVPVARGGSHDMSNVWLLDHQVNIAKGTMSAEEFVAMCREVMAQHDKGTAEARIGTPPEMN